MRIQPELSEDLRDETHSHVCPELLSMPAICYSHIHKFHQQRVARYCYIYYTQVLHVSAIYPGHLQGDTWAAYIATCHSQLVYYIQKKKESHYRSGHTLRIPEVCGSQISRHSAHESGKVVSPTHRPPLPPPPPLKKFLVFISVRG